MGHPRYGSRLYVLLLESPDVAFDSAPAFGVGEPRRSRTSLGDSLTPTRLPGVHRRSYKLTRRLAHGCKAWAVAGLLPLAHSTRESPSCDHRVFLTKRDNEETGTLRALRDTDRRAADCTVKSLQSPPHCTRWAAQTKSHRPIIAASRRCRLNT